MLKRARSIGCILIMLSLLTSCIPIVQGPEDPQTGEATNQNQEQYQAERAIFIESVATGAIIGGAIGGVAARLAGASPLIGIFVGAAVGAAVGDVVAEEQISDYREVKLENEKLEQLIKAAETYNAEVAQQNTIAEQKLTEIKDKEGNMQKVLAAAEVIKLQQQQEQLQQALDDRRQISEALEAEQSEQYKQTLAELEKEDEHLNVMIEEAKAISETGYVGPVS